MYCIVTRQFCNCCSMVWACMESKWKGKNYILSFLSGGGGKKIIWVLFYNVFSDVIFNLCILIVSGIENYPSACISCCSDDLSLLLLSGIQECVINSENKFFL